MTAQQVSEALAGKGINLQDVLNPATEIYDADTYYKGGEGYRIKGLDAPEYKTAESEAAKKDLLTVLKPASTSENLQRLKADRKLKLDRIRGTIGEAEYNKSIAALEALNVQNAAVAYSPKSAQQKIAQGLKTTGGQRAKLEAELTTVMPEVSIERGSGATVTQFDDTMQAPTETVVGTTRTELADTDKYGRQLIDNPEFAKYMISKGLAVPYASGNPEDAYLTEAGKQAKENKVGLWSDPNAVAEMESKYDLRRLDKKFESPFFLERSASYLGNLVDATQHSIGRTAAGLGDAAVDIGLELGAKFGSAISGKSEEELNKTFKENIKKTPLAKYYDDVKGFTGLGQYKKAEEYGYDDSAIQEYGEDFKKTMFDPNASVLDKVGVFLKGAQYAPEILANSSGDMLMAALPGGLPMMLASSANDFIEARAEIKGGRDKLNWQDYGIALGAGAVYSYVNKFTGGNAGLKSTKDAVKQVAGALDEAAVRTIGQNLRSYAKNVGKAGVEEGVEEIIQGMAETVGAKLATEKQNEILSMDTLKEQALSGTLGFWGAAGPKAVVSPVQALREKGYTPSEIGTAIKNEFTNKSANDITKVKDEIASQEYAPVGRGAERVSAMETAFAADGFDVAKGLDTIKAATADLNEDEIKSIMPKLDEYIDKVEQAEAARLNNIADNGTDDDIKQYGSEPYDMLMNRHITDEKAEVLANKLKASKQYDDVEIDTALQLRKVLNSGDKLTTEEVGSEVRTEGWNKSTKQSILSWFRGAVNTNIPEKARNYYTNNFLRFAALQEAKLEKLQAGAKGAQNKLESEFERLLGERTDVTMEDMYNAAIFSADLANGDKYRDAFNKVNISHKLFREIRKKLHSFNYAADISSVGKAVKEGNFDITLKQALADYALKNRADLAMDSNKSKDLKPSGLQTVINNVSNENATIDKLLKRIYKVNGIEEVAAGTGDLDTVAPAAPQSTPLQNAMDAKNEYAATKEGMIEPSYDDSGYNPTTQFRGLDTSLDYNNLDTKSKTYDSFKKVIASYLANPKEFVAGLTEQEKPAFAQLAANGSLAVDKIANEMIEPKDNGNKGQTTIDFDAEVEQTGPTVLDQMPGLTDVELSVAKIKAHPAYEAFIKLMRPKGATGKNKVVTSAERRSLSKDNPARYLQTSVALFNRLVKGEKPLTDVQQKTILEDLGMLEKMYEGDYKGVGLSITPKTKVQPKPKIKDSSTDKKGPTADEMFSAGRGTNVDQNETLKKLKGPGLPVAVKNYLEQAAKKGISAEDAKARVQRVLAEDYNETLDKEITDIWEKNKEYKYTKGKIRDKVREARAAIYTNKEATEAEKLRGKTEVTKELRNIEAEAEEIIMQKELKEMYTSEVKQAREAYKGLTFVMKHSQVLMDEDIDPTDKEMYNKLIKQKGDLKNKLRIGHNILKELKFQMNKSLVNAGFMDYVRAALDTAKVIAAASYELYKDLKKYRLSLKKEVLDKHDKWKAELKVIEQQLDVVIKKIKADEKAKINELNNRLRKTKVGVRESAMYNSKLLTELHALVSNVDTDTTKAASTKRDFNANGKPLELDPSKYLKTVNNSNNTLATQDVRTLKKRTLEGEYISVLTGLPDTLNHLIKVASATVASWDKKLELGTNPNKGVNSMPRLYEDPARALLLNPTDGLNVNVVVAAMQSMYEKMLDGGSELWDRDLEATFRDYFPDSAAVDMEAIKILAKAGKMPKRLTTEIGLATLDKLGLAKAGEKNEYAEEYSRLAASLGSFAISMAITEGSLLRNDMPLRKFQELTGAVTVSEDDKAHVKFVKLNLDDKSLDDIKRHYDNIKQNIEYPAAVKKHRWMPKTYNEDSNIDKVDCGNVM